MAAPKGQVPAIMKQAGLAPWLYLAPALLIMLFFVVYPTINTISLSFLDTEGVQSAATTCREGQPCWGILENYRRALTEETMLLAFRNNPLWIIPMLPGTTAPGLIIAVLVVLLRGRGGEEEFYPSDEFVPTYDQVRGWDPGSGGGMPPMQPPLDSETSATTPGWPATEAPVAPVPEPSGPQPGGTRLIERAPKHLAMLINKSNPDQKHDLRKVTNIGRAQDNHLVIDEPTVSRHHAWIKADGEDFSVFDIGSANGTFVNNEKVEEPRLLEQGDSVRFGDAEFIFTKVF